MEKELIKIYADSVTEKLRYWYINCIHQENNNTLWLGTNLGLIRLNKKEQLASEIILPKESELPEIFDPLDQPYMSICQIIPNTAQRSFWLSTDRGLFLFDPEYNTFKSYIPKYVHVNMGNSILTWAEYESTGSMWITYNGWLYRFNPDNETFDPIYQKIKRYPEPHNSNARPIVDPAHKNRLILTFTEGEIVVLNTEDLSYSMLFENPEAKKSINTIDQATPGIDSFGNLWIGSNNEGIVVVQNLNNPFEAVWEISKKGWFDSLGYMPRSIAISQDNKLWIGGGFFLRAFDLKEKKLGPERFYWPPECFTGDFGVNGIHFIKGDPAEGLWISSGTCYQKYNNRTMEYSLINPYINENPGFIQGVEWDSLGFMWAAGGDQVNIVRMNVQTGKYIALELDPIYVRHRRDKWIDLMHKTSKGDILFQNRRNLYSLDIIEDSNPKDIPIEKSRFKEVIPSHLLEELIGNGGDYIKNSAIDNFDHIWFGTRQNGLFHYDPENQSLINYSEENGLTQNRINTIIVDGNNRVWVGCFTGLNCLIQETGEILNFSESDGLISSNFHFGGWEYVGKSQIDTQGNIYMGTNRGVIYFDPERVIESIKKPRVVLSSLYINNEQVGPGQKKVINKSISYFPDIHLKYTDKQVTFQYSVTDFTRNYNRIEYQHMLEGFDDQWIDVGSRTYITYSNIPSGKYQLKINASSTGSFIEEDAVIINIYMAPPPWATWWAYTLYVLFAIGAIWGFIAWRTYEQKRKLREVEKINTRLREVDQLKDQFLANTSHELRTPLQGIIGLAESLKDRLVGKLPGTAVEDLNMINSSGKRLANLVNDILDFSKLKKHDLELQLKPVDIRTIVEVVFSVLQPLIKTKDLELSYDIPDNLPSVMADENRMQQILHNLLGNAIKFTEKGSVQLSAEMNEEMVAVKITDTGIGIPAEKLDSIFKSFEQVEGGISREYGGTGLGLSITRQLVELQGGNIEVDSEPGKGSTFTFTLPVSDEKTIEKEKVDADLIKQHVKEEDKSGDIVEEKVTKGEQAQIDEIETSPLNGRVDILVVDDEPVNLQVLKNHLSFEGYHVTLANNGMEAIDLIEKGNTYDLIILDIMMPKLSGYEVCQKLRELFLPSELPVVMLTAKNQVLDLVDGFKTGANDYLTKPFSKDELLSRIKTHLNLQRIHRATGKFVPYEFLRAIGRDSITEVNLGDQVHKEVSILFLDILEYTTLSENMTPEENFLFINEFVGQLGPVIAENNGFVNQYIGDAIMAIFPDNAEDGLKAAIEMQKKLDEFNTERTKEGKKEIRMGIGLHSGPLIMGIIGDKHHAEPTTIADTVNISSRLEGLTRQYGVRIIASEDSVEQIKDVKQFNLRYLGQALVKGKQKPIKMYECIDGDQESILTVKTNLRSEFESGLEHFYKKEFPEASVVFNNIIKQNADDHAAGYFYKRAARYAADGVEEDWTGIEKWDVK
jgi:signal transduction histidine kinase/class 3 adenylate cyclase/ligand-binding sensor domain-containing protein